MLRDAYGPRGHAKYITGLLRRKTRYYPQQHQLSLMVRQPVKKIPRATGLHVAHDGLLGARSFVGPVGQVFGWNRGSYGAAQCVGDLMRGDAEDE